jgi:hypothetical protein
MKAESPDETVDPRLLAEKEAAVLRLLTEGTPVPPEIARRIDERADRITERIRRTHGVIDDDTFQSLMSDDET